MAGNASQHVATKHEAGYRFRHERSAAGKPASRRARIVWYALVPSAFIVTFASLLWLDVGSQLANSVAASQPAIATTTQDFLHAPAGDPSVPHASDTAIPAGDAEPHTGETF